MPQAGDDSIHFLFRFRDLVAPTIEQHRQVITDHQSCWWGWWKRPSEDHRVDIWQALRDAVSNRGRVPVGLFDSGNGIVYRAWVTDVVLPLDQPHLANATPEVPPGERELIPAYYRESPFSRAWMRFDAIESPIEFFGNYAFAESPSLPNYDLQTLARLNGKVILSSEELRGMDTTIWKVRPKGPGDREEKIIFTIPRLPIPVSHDAVRAQSDSILHITDPHFAIGANRAQHIWRLESETDQPGRKTLAEAVSSALPDQKIGVVLVTGDLTFTGEESEFDEAAKSILRLLGILDLSTDQLVVIPGNHDIRWTTQATYNEGDEVNQAPEAARANFVTFYKRIFGHEPNMHLSMGRRYLLPCGLGVEICALNSSSLEQGHNYLAGMGRIEEASFGDVASRFGWTRRQLALRVLAVHHHLVLTEDLEPAAGYLKGFGIAVDAPRIQRMAAKYGVQLALHGHKHRPFMWRSSVYELPEFAQHEHRLGELAIVGGGSAGSKDTVADSNYFNLLQVGTGDLSLTIWRSQNRGLFHAFQTWKAALEINSTDGLILGDWQERN